MPSDNPTITLPFEAGEDSAAERPDLRVRLEAEAGAASGSRPTLDDLDAMTARAASGMSARTVVAERCKAARFGADGEVIVTLAVLVWPSRADLRYELDLPPEATPGAVEVIREERQYKAWASGGGVIELPWRMESASPAWAYGCWDEFSRAIPGPALSHDQARIIVGEGRDGGVQGIVTVAGMAVGYRHEFSLAFGKIDPESGAPTSIDIDSVPVAARWTGADGEEETAELDLPIPDCAKSLLAACPDGEAVFSGRAKEAEADVYEVAYSSCSGKMLAIRKVEAGK